MLTVLVITFIVAKYLNNSGGVFLIPDIKKRIKTTIQDPERAAAMLGAVFRPSWPANVWIGG